MKRIVRLTERDLTRIIKKVVNEEEGYWEKKMSTRQRDSVVDMYVKQSMQAPEYRKSLVITTESGETYTLPL